ncbi:hypothetical protein [Yersinia enterocolitica]|uniref:hypothetical protein n=1 Tax=Yersinia enterocolitica TaxID=630 RepID=UPI0018DEEB19|nr:hypothetical protein [Yersinia enterocolitica]
MTKSTIKPVSQEVIAPRGTPVAYATTTPTGRLRDYDPNGTFPLSLASDFVSIDKYISQSHWCYSKAENEQIPMS